MFKQILDNAAIKLDKCGAEQWEAALLHRRSLTLGIREDALDSLRESEDMGLSLRLLKDGRPGFSFLLGSDLRRLDASIELALAGARVSDPAPGFSFSCAYDLAPFNPSLEYGVMGEEHARLLARSARSASPAVTHVYPAETSQSMNQVFLRTSNGFDGHYRYSLVWAGCTAIAEKDGQQEEAWESESAACWREMDLAALGHRAGLKAAASLGARAAESGRYPVLLSNEVAAYFVSLLGASLKADNIGKGRSLLAGRQGEQVVSRLLNLCDDPLRAPQTRPFDGEGTASQVTTLLENGVMRDFIRDRYWGARLNLPSTGGSSRADSKNPPEVGFSNLVLAPGTAAPGDMIKGGGIIVEQVMGGHTADVVSGQFSLGLAGKLVADGEIVAPIRGNAFAGQVLQLFSQVSQVGNDVRVFGQIHAPSLLIDELAVSGPAR